MQNMQFDPVYIIIATVILIVWFSHLESKVNRNDKDVEKITKKHDNLSTVMEKK